MDIVNTDFEFGINIDDVEAFSNKGVLKDFSTSDLHTHPYHQVLLITSGVTLFESINRIIPQYGNMGAFIPAGLGHRTLAVQGNVAYCSLYIHAKYIQRHSNEIIIFRFSPLSRALLERLCTRNLISLTQELSGECLSLFLKLIQDDFINNCHNISLPVAKTTAGQEIIEYIKNNYTEKLTLNKICSIVPYTTRHISRIFINDVGISIISYVRMYRVLQSSIKIQNTDEPVTSIAYSCGYESLSCFYRDFGFFIGIRPHEFRS